MTPQNVKHIHLEDLNKIKIYLFLLFAIHFLSLRVFFFLYLYILY